MKVSVIIPTLNRWQFLDECLTSIAAQTMTDWEAIVVNDASDEPDTDRIREKWSDARFQWIDHPTRRGIAAARNSGIRAARSPLVFTLDNDDMLYPQCLERLSEALVDPEIDCAFSDFEFFGTESRIHRFEDLPIADLAITQFIPAQMMMRKTLWEKVEGYCEDEGLAFGNEDWDFCLSAAEAGFRFRHVHETLYRYRVHAGGISKSTLIRNDYRTREVMYRRHRLFIDRHSQRGKFVGPGYWRSAAAFCEAGATLKSLFLGLRAFLLLPDAPLARDLLRRNIFGGDRS